MRTIELRFQVRVWRFEGSTEAGYPTAAVSPDRAIRCRLAALAPTLGRPGSRASFAYLEWPQDSGPVRRAGGGDDVVGESSEDRGLWRRHRRRV